MTVHVSLSYEDIVVEDGEKSEDGVEKETPYQIFKQYLVDLENNLRLMDIQSVAFGALEPDSGTVLTFNLDIITYHK